MKTIERYLPSFHVLSMNKKSSPDPDWILYSNPTDARS
jgi:hypothetical protein|tara:strand:+ start:219 stop:332 length:114 start_codon:yes stop_codon:yes gene_type:complete